MRKPLEWPKAVTRCACAQCGSIKEINQQHADLFLQIIKKPAPAAGLKNFYFQVSFCEYCQQQPLVIHLLAL